MSLLLILFTSLTSTAAIETRMGMNIHDTPRTLLNSDLRASRNNFEMEFLLPFDRVLVGLAFEQYGLDGFIEEQQRQLTLNYKRTAALIGYRFGRGQYGPVDVTSDIIASYGILNGIQYKERVGNEEQTFKSELESSTSLYFSGTYGYGAVIGGLKLGYQWTRLGRLQSSSQASRSLNLSSPFIGLSLGLFF